MWDLAVPISIILLSQCVKTCKMDQYDDNEIDTCSIEIMPKNLDYSRREFDSFLGKQARMVYIYLKSDKELENFLKDKYNDDQGKLKEHHSLTNWIWTSKDDSFLLSLPVDIDAATFGLMRQDVYEMDIELTGYPQNCSSNFNKTYNKNIIFDYLYKNITKTEITEGYLCKRIFNNQEPKTLLYHFLTIWSGYDFRCYYKTFDNNASTKTIQKSTITVILYVIQFIVMNFFLLSFVFLCSESNTHMFTDFFIEGDTPYSPRRFLHNLLHYKGDNDSDDQSEGNAGNTSERNAGNTSERNAGNTSERNAGNTGEIDRINTRNKKWFSSTMSQVRLLSIFWVFCALLMTGYYFSFKNYVKNPKTYQDIYKFYNVGFFLSMFTFVFVLLCLLIFINNFDVYVYRVRVRDGCIQYQNVINIVKFKTSDEVIKKLVTRLAVVISPTFWKYMFAEPCSPCYSVVFDICCNIVLVCINVVLCLVPTFWVLLILPLHVIFSKEKGNCSILHLFAYLIWTTLFGLSISVPSLNSVFYGPISYLTRIVTYIVFVAIPYNLNAPGILVIMTLLTATSYGLKYVTSFLSIYKNVLNLMFEIDKESETSKAKLTPDSNQVCNTIPSHAEQIIDRNSSPPPHEPHEQDSNSIQADIESGSNGDRSSLSSARQNGTHSSQISRSVLGKDIPKPNFSTVYFDKVIEKTFPVGLYFGVMVLKIITITAFIYISGTVLTFSNKDYGVKKSILVEYIFVIISPAVLMKLFYVSPEQTVQQKKSIIKSVMEELDASTSTDTSNNSIPVKCACCCCCNKFNEKCKACKCERECTFSCKRLCESLSEFCKGLWQGLYGYFCCCCCCCCKKGTTTYDEEANHILPCGLKEPESESTRNVQCCCRYIIQHCRQQGSYKPI